MENLTTQFASVSLVKEFKFIPIEELEPENDALIDWNNLLPQQLAQRFLELYFTAEDNSKILMFQNKLFYDYTGVLEGNIGRCDSCHFYNINGTRNNGRML
jgi:hypothetical protein